MAWIAIVDPDTSDAPLTALFAAARGPSGEIDNILAVHGLRPHTLGGHMALYRSVLHHSANTLPKPLYAEVLTLRPFDVTETMVDAMRSAGFDDGPIFEVGQPRDKAG